MDYADVELPETGERLSRESFEALHAAPEPQQVLGHLNPPEVVDDDGRVTAAGWEFAGRDISPPPHGLDAPAGAPSTHARRTHDAHGRAAA